MKYVKRILQKRRRSFSKREKERDLFRIIPGRAANTRRVFQNHIHPVKTYIMMHTQYISDQSRLIFFIYFIYIFLILIFRAKKAFLKKWLQNICILRGFPKNFLILQLLQISKHKYENLTCSRQKLAFQLINSDIFLNFDF